MRHKILLLVFSLASLVSFAQSGVVLHGYLQDVLPGMVPKGTDENGKALGAHTATTRVLIYLELPRSAAATPVEVWINGKRYGVQAEKITSFPVTLSKGAVVNSKPVLLPARSGNVLELIPVAFTKGKDFSKAKTKARSNELVVVYKMGGSYYSAVQKKWKSLEPQVNE